MSTSETPDPRLAFTTRLVQRAWEDPAFKQELLANPKAVVEQELKLSIPANVQVEALAETPNKLYIVVPMNPNAAPPPERELSDQELEAVAGGLTWGCAPW